MSDDEAEWKDNQQYWRIVNCRWRSAEFTKFLCELDSVNQENRENRISRGNRPRLRHDVHSGVIEGNALVVFGVIVTTRNGFRLFHLGNRLSYEPFPVTTTSRLTLSTCPVYLWTCRDHWLSKCIPCIIIKAISISTFSDMLGPEPYACIL